MKRGDIILVPGAGWKWKCPLCNDLTEYTSIISTDFKIVKSFKETHMKKHTISKEYKEDGR